MVEWARISNATVVEIISFDPVGKYNPALVWVAVPDGLAVDYGWSYSGGAFAAPSPPPGPTVQQQAVAAIASGVAVLSVSNPVGLDASYPVDDGTVISLLAEMLSLVVNGTFTNGTATISFPDVTGTFHVMTVTQFKSFATLIGGYVGALKPLAAGVPGTLPQQPITIA